jgi:hypothetical protein
MQYRADWRAHNAAIQGNNGALIECAVEATKPGNPKQCLDQTHPRASASWRWC